MGQGGISGERWPLKQTQFTSYYLDSKPQSGPSHDTGSLSTQAPQNDHSDRYVYDPAYPVPTTGGGMINIPARDRSVAIRTDVLLYRTAPLETPVTIAGPVEAVLYVSSSAKDTDFMVKLLDVYPDGKIINLAQDAFRVRYRRGFDKRVLMQPGEVYKITLPNMVTAIRFARGHRIGVQISSSDFPLHERNLNTGGNNYDEMRRVVAENSAHHGGRYPSHVVLPVLP